MFKQNNINMENNSKGWEIDLLPVKESKQSGDCILLRFGDLFAGKQKQNVFIIDGGFSDTAKSIKEHLKKYYNCYYDGVYHITGMILSHPDQDHISGLVELLIDKQIKISNLIVNAPWKTLTRSWFKDGRITNNSLKVELQDVFNKLNELITLAIERHNAKILYGVDSLGELTCNGAKFTILGPDKMFYNTCMANSEKTKDKSEDVKSVEKMTVKSLDKEELYIPGKIKWAEIDSTSAINESSIVFLFEYEGFKMLFTGDCGRIGLKTAIDYADRHSINLADTQVIKMPHHGSRHNIDLAFLDRFTHMNRACYISCAKDDEGHHPSKRLVNILNEKGFKVYSTSGSTLHRSSNAPDRGWVSAKKIECYPTMEKLDM